MLRGAIYGITAAAIWGGMYVVSDSVLKVIPPFTLLTIRLMMGSLILGGLLYLKHSVGATRRVSPTNGVDFTQSFPNRGVILRLLGVGFIGFGISVGAQFVGTDLSTAVNGSLVTSASPAFILIFAALLLREKLTAQRIFAVGLATIGVLVIVNPANADFGSDTFRGDVALAIAAVTWGLYSVLVRMVSAKTDTLIVTFFAFLGGMFLTIPAAIVELPNRPIGTIDASIIAGVLFLGVISTAVAMWLWNRAFALVDASVASLFFFAQPLVGAFLAAVFLDQGMTTGLWMGGALIVLGVLLALYPLEKLTKARSPQPELAHEAEISNIS